MTDQCYCPILCFWGRIYDLLDSSTSPGIENCEAHEGSIIMININRQVSQAIAFHFPPFLG